MSGVVLMLFLWSLLASEAFAQGRIVSTKTYQGVIFTPEMIHAPSEIWKYPDDAEKKAILWTPSAALIAATERTLSSRLNEIGRIIPPEGFHFQEYYTPKYSSRDRNPPPSVYVYTPECVSLEEWASNLRSSRQRQYIGVTANGEKALLINFFNDPSSEMWKTVWRSNWPYFYYLIEKEEFTPALFTWEMEDR